MMKRTTKQLEAENKLLMNSLTYVQGRCNELLESNRKLERENKNLRNSIEKLINPESEENEPSTRIVPDDIIKLEHGPHKQPPWMPTNMSVFDPNATIDGGGKAWMESRARTKKKI
jgi:hypothetical protein